MTSPMKEIATETVLQPTVYKIKILEWSRWYTSQKKEMTINDCKHLD